MNEVWLLWFEQEQENEEDIELLIGVYPTEESANSAIKRVVDQPGFQDYPQGFKAHKYTLGQDSWTEGFIRD